MNPIIAARVFTVLIAGAIFFQLALVVGMPWGKVAWGGAFPGVLPPHMRVASIGSAVLLLALALVVLVRAGLIQSKWKSSSGKLAWVVVTYCSLGVIANAITQSFWERVIWLPVTILLLGSSIVVARAR